MDDRLTPEQKVKFISGTKKAAIAAGAIAIAAAAVGIVGVAVARSEKGPVELPGGQLEQWAESYKISKKDSVGYNILRDAYDKSLTLESFNKYLSKNPTQNALDAVYHLLIDWTEYPNRMAIVNRLKSYYNSGVYGFGRQK